MVPRGTPEQQVGRRSISPVPGEPKPGFLHRKQRPDHCQVPPAGPAWGLLQALAALGLRNGPSSKEGQGSTLLRRPGLPGAQASDSAGLPRLPRQRRARQRAGLAIRATTKAPELHRPLLGPGFQSCQPEAAAPHWGQRAGTRGQEAPGEAPGDGVAPLPLAIRSGAVLPAQVPLSSPPQAWP